MSNEDARPLYSKNIDKEHHLAAMEAVLFACGEPVSMERLADALGISPGALPMLSQELNERYERVHSGLMVLRLAHQFQLTTRPEFAEQVRTALDTKRLQPLTQAAMEVLTIIAYNQPVTKGFVEHVRGVDSSSVVNSLIDKGLLEEAGRLEVPGKPLAYKTTENFLRCFQLSSLNDLPPLPGKPSPTVSTPTAETVILPPLPPSANKDDDFWNTDLPDPGKEESL